jgi:hypothetical protein
VCPDVSVPRPVLKWESPALGVGGLRSVRRLERGPLSPGGRSRSPPGSTRP